MGTAAYRRLLLAIALAAPLLLLAPTAPAIASDSPVSGQVRGGPGMEAQVQIPIPNFDFNPTKWVQDAFGTLLQSFTDGIRAGMDASWAANFITQTPPSLTYQNGDIRGLYGTMRGAANGALALIATVGARNGDSTSAPGPSIPLAERLRPALAGGRHSRQYRLVVDPVRDRRQ